MAAAHQHRLPGQRAARPAREPTSELDKLHDALGGEGWHEIEAEDGTVRLNLATSSACAPRATSTASASAIASAG